MKKITLILSLFVGVLTFSQNLVPNPSFEQYSTCPNNDNQVYLAIGWEGCGDTPDYFNSCSIIPDFSVPYNWGGYQQASSGNAYCGIGTYNSPFQNAREIIISQLASPLVIGTKYYISFKVALSLNYPMYFNTASNNLGALFTTSPHNFTNPITIQNFAHLNSSNIITDTTNWTTISGSFIADSAYQYAAFGNFFNDINTDTLIFNLDNGCQFSSCQTAYYYLDDVCVSSDSLICNPSAGLYKHTENNDLSISLNPTIEKIVINTNVNSNSEIEIYDLDGKLFYKTTITNYTEIEYSNWSSGIYFIQIKNNLFNKTEKLTIINP